MDPLEREARRVFHRYQTEVVEVLGFCPWAKQAREDARARAGVPRPGHRARGGPALDEIRADRDAAYVRVQGAGAGEGASASVVGVVAETSIK